LNKYFYPLTILFLVIFTATYIAKNEFQTDHYDNGEISFDYPSNWQITSSKNPSQVIAFSNDNSGHNITVNKQFMPSSYNHPPNFIINSTESLNSGFKLISQKSLNLNQEQAYENIYYHYSAGRLTLRKESGLRKTDTCTA
jgi:sortase A